jgi:hypothetical protein
VADFLAIAGVSATLRNLLRDRMEVTVPVTIAPPDVTVSGVSGRRVNLYLYRVTENGSLRNQEIPGQGHPAAYGRPPLSLDLHYLLTSYGSSDDGGDADLEAQQLLGDAMRVMHEYPIITEAMHENDDPADPLVLDPRLLGEFERVKVTLQPTTLDETSKIWTALPEVSFRRSVSYNVSVVQIESRRPRRATLPVREPRVYAVPMQTPYVDEIVRDPVFPGIRGAVAEVGDTIVLRGRNLRGVGGTRVTLGGEVVVPAAPGAARISLSVPAALTPGTHAVQVLHDLLLDAQPGNPPVPHRGFQSNALPLLVIPRFVGAAPAPAGAGALVTVTVAPPVRATQEKVLLLGDFAVPAEPVPHDAPPSANVQFRLPTGSAAIPPAIYLVRVRVDGAESRLTIDSVTTRYVGPTLEVT